MTKQDPGWRERGPRSALEWITCTWRACGVEGLKSGHLERSPVGRVSSVSALNPLFALHELPFVLMILPRSGSYDVAYPPVSPLHHMCI